VSFRVTDLDAYERRMRFRERAGGNELATMPTRPDAPT
jgi:hypothetical protein